jgi:glycosyltransferase involved in cell wall biosynthesis
MTRRPSITAFFPAYNDAGTIASMVVAVHKTLEALTDDFEVIVVENGSTDHTVEILEELARRYERLRVLSHREPLGYGGALRVGFANATKELIFYTDGDAQYDPRELRHLLPALLDSVDIVNGWKLDRSDPVIRIIIGRLYNRGVKTLFGLRLRDVDCDFRLIRRSVFDVVDLESDSGTICLEFVKKTEDAGFRYAEVPVHHFHRSYGKSQFFNFPRLWRTGVQLIGLWWKLNVRREHLRHIAQRRARLAREAAQASADPAYYERSV